MIHVAITRIVRAGREEEFEEKIAEFFHQAEKAPQTQGAYLLRPMGAPGSREYGILRSFTDERARDEFYASKLYSDWQEAVRDLVEGEPVKRDLHGLEAFFRAGGNDPPPPAWKMALVTWLGVNPAVYIFATLVPLAFGLTHPLVELALVNALVVASLTWFFMPVLIRIFRPWLQPQGSEHATRAEQRGTT